MTALRAQNVCNSDAEANRRADMGMVMDRKSIGVRGDYGRTPTPDVGNYFSDRELREEFSALVSGYTARQLSRASGCTIDAAKMWLAGKRIPSTTSTFNMARNGLTVVQDWAADKIGTGGDRQRETLRRMVAEEVGAAIKKPPAESIGWHPDNVVRDLFKRA